MNINSTIAGGHLSFFNFIFVRTQNLGKLQKKSCECRTHCKHLDTHTLTVVVNIWLVVLRTALDVEVDGDRKKGRMK